MTRRVLRVGIVAAAAVAMSSGALFALPAQAAPICTGSSGPAVCVQAESAGGFTAVEVREGTAPHFYDATGAIVLCGPSGLKVRAFANGSVVADRSIPV